MDPLSTRTTSEISSHTDAPRTEYALAPFAILRIASIPADALQKLRPPRALNSIKRLLFIEASMHDVASKLRDRLFQVVPQLGSLHDVRRHAIRLQRDIHNRRAPATNNLTEQLLGLCGANTEALFAEYCDLHAGYSSTLIQASTDLTEDLETISRPYLSHLCKLPLINSALALANPNFHRQLQTGTNQDDRHQAAQRERTLVAYILRASSKTSPFSTFMLNACFMQDIDATALPTGLADVTIYVWRRPNRGILHLIWQTVCSTSEGLDSLSVYSSNEIPISASWNTYTISYSVVHGRLWRSVVPKIVHVNSRLAQILNDISLLGKYNSYSAARFSGSKSNQFSVEPASGREWLEILVRSGVPVQTAPQVLRQAIQYGVLSFNSAITAYDECADLRLRELMPASCEASAALLDLFMDIGGTRHEPPSSDRYQALKRAESMIANMSSQHLTMQANRVRNVIIEDAYVRSFRIEKRIDISSELSRIANIVGTNLYYDECYIVLSDMFASEHGENGICTDVVAFLRRCEAKILTLFSQTLENNTSAIPRRLERADKIGITLFLQCETINKPGRPSKAVIVNRIFERVGWLAARHAWSSIHQNSLFADQLRSWLDIVYAPREVIDMPVCGECNDLQAHPRVTKRVLAIPGEPVQALDEHIISVEALCLKRDPSSGRVEVFDRKTDEPVVLVSLGSVIPSIGWGMPFLLSILSHPYKFIAPLARESKCLIPKEVFYEAELRYDNVVLSRARWIVSSEYLRREWFAVDSILGILKIARECEKLNISDVFYVRAKINEKELVFHGSGVSRKPLIVDRFNPLSLSLLQQITNHSEWVIIEEAIPRPEQSSFTIGSQIHTGEYHLEMLIKSEQLECAQCEPVP